MKKLFYISFLALLFSLSTKAQIDTTGANTHSWRCGNDSIMFSLLKDSTFIKARIRYDSSVVGKTSSGTYIIPVVFHIIIPTGSTYTVSYAQIKWQVAELNAAFQKQMNLYTGQPYASGTRAVNTNFEFRLACIPSPTTGVGGWSATEPGVVRYATTNTVVLNQGVLDPTTNNAMLAMTHPSGSYFPFSKYLNIWCVPNITSGGPGTVLGFGTFPWMGYTLDGIVMRLDCIGSDYYSTGFSMFPNYDKGVTLAHEAGHYLGLYHTFQPNQGGNFNLPISCYGTTSVTATNDGDLVYDTPPTKINFDLGSITTINSCNENYYPYALLQDESDQLENYMGYSDDNKRNTFTQGQSNRMAATTYTNTLNNRSVLVSSANLTATGVSPYGCSNYTNILTGIFNYGITAGGCSNTATIQFTNPTSTGFSATSYTWTYGDGSASTYSANPTHSYTSTSTSSYTVSCTASNGTTTATYTSTISTSNSVSITGCSGTTNTVSPFNSAVCRGKEETIFITFSAGVHSAVITNGTSTLTVNNYMVASNTVVVIPYLITPSGSASYSLTPFCNNGVATFNVTDCCPSLIANGDFESGNTGFSTDLFHSTAYVTGNFGAYDVAPLNSTCYFSSLAPYVQNVTGKILQVDGFAGNNTIVNVPPSCTSTLTPKVWQEVVTGLQPNTTYFYSFKILENYQSSSGCPLTFCTNITGTVTPLPTQTLVPTWDYVGTPTVIDWLVYTYTFTTPSTGFTSANNFTITINQIKDFAGGFYDYFIDNITLQAMTPAIQALGSATICLGNSTPLTLATNCSANVSDYTYTWSPSTGLSCTTCTATSASPTSTTVYTLTAVATSTLTNPPNAISTVTVTVSANSCSGEVPPTSYTVTTPGSYTLSISPSFIAQDMELDNGVNYTFKCADLRIAAGKTITVKNGATLTIDGSWLHACSSCMWQGIYVENGATIIVKNYSIIEDAVYAIKTQSNASATPVPAWNISNTIFNKNGTAVYVDAHIGNLASNFIWNTIFTCRNLGSHLVGTPTFTVGQSNFNSIKTDITAATPILTSSVNPIANTLNGNRSSEGIFFIDITSTTSIITVGDRGQANNLFDNLDGGIYGVRSGVTVKNNRFQNLTGHEVYGLPYGVGVFMVGTSGGSFNPVIIGNSSTTVDNSEKNYFINCLDGIWMNDYSKVLINNNNFDNETTATAFTTGLVTGHYGAFVQAYAVGSSTVTTEQLQFANNSSQNYNTGLYLDFQKLYSTSASNSYITTNTITATGSNYCNYGLYLQQSNYGANTGVPVNGFDITANTITGIGKNCVSINSVNTATATTGFLTVHNNTDLSVKYVSTATAIASPRLAAVYVAGSNYVKVSNNYNLHSTNTSTVYASGNAEYVHGIYVYQSPNSRVNCNTPTNLGEDFVWEGSSAGSQWLENTMHNSRYGLVLRNTGIMGDQGTGGHPNYLTWGNSDISSAQTLADASDPSASGSTSKLNCAGVATCTTTNTDLPCVNSTLNFGTAYLYTVTTFTVRNLGSPGLCTSEGGNGRMMSGSKLAKGDSTVTDSVLYAMLNFKDSLPVNTWQTHWSTQYYVNSTRTHIPAVQGYENAKTFALIDGSIANGNYSNASGMNNAITPNNIIERNWQSVDNIIIKLQSDTLNQNDVNTLQNIAAQCPLRGGSIVWRARAILNSYFKNIIEYPNDCSGSLGISSVNKTTAITSVTENQTINLYPNPNNGSMTLAYNINKDAVLEITDISGKLVDKYDLSAAFKIIEIKNDKLQNGVYLYSVISNGNMLKAGKIVIMK